MAFLKWMATEAHVDEDTLILNPPVTITAIAVIVSLGGAFLCFAG
ncbi:MAG TPA: hypothetical protein PKD34_02970 [Candidatus Doudnabacteria bacterium]|nr:hypothetical protein [Candidatus Doudnabacteria bacterium]